MNGYEIDKHGRTVVRKDRTISKGAANALAADVGLRDIVRFEGSISQAIVPRPFYVLIAALRHLVVMSERTDRTARVKSVVVSGCECRITLADRYQGKESSAEEVVKYVNDEIKGASHISGITGFSGAIRAVSRLYLPDVLLGDVSNKKQRDALLCRTEERTGSLVTPETQSVVLIRWRDERLS